MSKDYSARDIEVLSGLEPVRRRPGMYTDTSRPNHLAHEVIDNSVDEAIAGHCKRITVIVFRDGSMEVADDGRGMPVDVHPKEKLPGVELILIAEIRGDNFAPAHVVQGTPFIDEVPLPHFFGTGIVVSLPKKKWESISTSFSS